MKNIDQTVLKETGYITYSVIILSILMESVFLIAGRWNYTVLLGNILSAAAVILNFFFMGLTVQAATQMEEKAARNRMKLSQSIRTFLLFGIAAVGVLIPCFNTVAVLIPLFFPRIVIGLRPLFMKRGNKNET